MCRKLISRLAVVSLCIVVLMVSMLAGTALSEVLFKAVEL
jgi:hypothetical protein